MGAGALLSAPALASADDLEPFHTVRQVVYYADPTTTQWAFLTTDYTNGTLTRTFDQLAFWSNDSAPQQHHEATEQRQSRQPEPRALPFPTVVVTYLLIAIPLLVSGEILFSLTR